MSLKSALVTVVVVTVGLVLGCISVLFGPGQTWWPLSVSGRPETVVTGILQVDPTGYPTGLFIQNPSPKTWVDLSRLPSRAATSHINRYVTIRGLAYERDALPYLLVTWLR